MNWSVFLLQVINSIAENDQLHLFRTFLEWTVMHITYTINFLMFIEKYLNSDQSSEWNFTFQKTHFFPINL